MKKLGTQTGTNTIQEIEERILGIEDMIKKWVLQSRKMLNLKKSWEGKYIQESRKRTNLRIRGLVGENETQVKVPENIFKRIIEENSPNLKKEKPMEV